MSAAAKDNATQILAVEPLTTAAFAPFGEVISFEAAREIFPINNGTTQRHHALAQIEVGAGHGLISLARAEPRSLPFAVTMLERHPLGSQAFIPLSKQPYLIVVAESPLHPPRCFLAANGEGVNYRAGTWHHPLIALDTVSDFLIVDRGGADHNCDEQDLPRAWWIDDDRPVRGLNNDVVWAQLDILCRFIENMACHRAIHSRLEDLRTSGEFWRCSSDAHLMLAVSDWCMIFGSEGESNPTHWKRIPDLAAPKFRDYLIASTGWDAHELRNYVQSVKQFRDNYVAHPTLGSKAITVPEMSRALEIAFNFDEWLPKAISPSEIAGTPLRAAFQETSTRISNDLDAVLGAIPRNL